MTLLGAPGIATNGAIRTLRTGLVALLRTEQEATSRVDDCGRLSGNLRWRNLNGLEVCVLVFIIGRWKWNRVGLENGERDSQRGQGKVSLKALQGMGGDVTLGQSQCLSFWVILCDFVMQKMHLTCVGITSIISLSGASFWNMI